MARSAFQELLTTLSGQRGLVEKFVTGFDTVTERDLLARMTAVLSEDVTPFDIAQTARQLARSVAAGDAFNAAGPGGSVAASSIPITRQLTLPTGERRRFVADVAVTVTTRLGLIDVEVTKLIEVLADRTLTVDELREQVLQSTEDLFREKGYGIPDLTTAEIDVKWVFLTR